MQLIVMGCEGRQKNAEKTLKEAENPRDGRDRLWRE